MPITLAMIVKNEAAGIAKTLRSVKPFIDRWVIADTGSTDDTMAIIEAEMAGLPGQVYSTPFIDFANTRNNLLDTCAREAPGSWLLLLDADDVLEGGEALQAFVAGNPQRYCHHLWITLAGSRHCLPRLVRSGSPWRYQGAVHEILSCPGQYASDPVDGVTLHHQRTPSSAEASRQRWERDKGLLEAAVAKDATDTRSVFYLARTLDALGDWSQAAAWYLKRSQMGGWDEERYVSLLSAGRCLAPNCSDWPAVQQLYLDAHALCPDRAEALCEIARHYVQAQAWPLAYLFAKRAYELPLPKRILFVEAAAHGGWAADLLATCAWYVGDKALGKAAAKKAALARPEDSRIQTNLTFYN